jgi:biotin carboxyl carrier protein
MDHLRITVEGKVYDVVVEKIGNETTAPVTRAAVPATVPAAAPAPAPVPAAVPKTAAGAGDAVSPLTGIVQAVDVAVGAVVKEGDLIITLEAMKMYTPINATTSGTVTAIHIKVGDSVEEGQVLYTIK